MMPTTLSGSPSIISIIGSLLYATSCYGKELPAGCFRRASLLSSFN
jgi:hypothetical protein